MSDENTKATETTDSAASALSAGLEPKPSPEYLAFRAAGCETVGDKRRWDAAVAFERERICAAIKAEDDHCADGDYMMDSDDCISVARGTWKRPDWNGSNANVTGLAPAQEKTK